ncbi:MAG TPA: hypothetical protein VIF43_02575 [Patescibacteria group bacterium]|jgi:hypothetical protein
MPRETLGNITISRIIEEIDFPGQLGKEEGQFEYAALAEKVLAQSNLSSVERANALAYLADHYFALEHYELAEVLYYSAEGVHVSEIGYTSSRLANYRVGRAKSLNAMDQAEKIKRMHARPGRYG